MHVRPGRKNRTPSQIDARGNKLTVAYKDFPVISLSVVSKFLGWFRGPTEKFTIFLSGYLKPTGRFEFSVVPVGGAVVRN